MEPKLIIHGGAWNIPEKMHQAHLDGCRRSIETIWPRLIDGMDAVTAVEQAVCLLEEDPTFDAGRGAFLNADGDIELDAIICDGRDLRFGAIAAVQNILHPVSAARLVMDRTEHCFLVGAGAQKFLKSLHFPEVPVEELLTARELEYYRKIKSDPKFKTRHPFEKTQKGTVGAVARDVQGNLAAATSTGGTPRKLPGRVGDSPVIGAGAYASNESGAVSATGYGESILRVLLAKQVCDAFMNAPPLTAAEKSIKYLHQKAEGLGGVIGLNRQGDYAFAHNTAFMAFAYMQNGQEVIAKITAY